MNIGMLWFDNDPKTGVDSKIERAATYYRTKYGKTPNLVFVHPSMVGSGTSPTGRQAPPPNGAHKNGEIEVRTSHSIRPNHFWIGVDAPLS